MYLSPVSGGEIFSFLTTTKKKKNCFSTKTFPSRNGNQKIRWVKKFFPEKFIQSDFSVNDLPARQIGRGPNFFAKGLTLLGPT